MANYRDDLLEIVGGEVVEVIVVHHDYYRELPEPPLYEQPLTWQECEHLLDYEYDPDGYEGERSVHNITVWTQTKVIYTHEYDGQMTLRYVPRHPPVRTSASAKVAVS